MRVTGVKPLFRRCHWGRPERGVAEDAFDSIGAEDGNPAIGFGEFVGNALLAPGRMLLAQIDHLLLQRGIPTGDEARFPGIEGAPAHVGSLTSQIDNPGGFPGLEQQPALLGRGQGKMDTFADTLRS